MSWTLTKKLDAFASPGEIKRRELVLDPQESPGETKSREVELGSKSCIFFFFLLQLLLNSSVTDIVLVTLFRTAVETAIYCVVQYLLRNGKVPTALT